MATPVWFKRFGEQFSERTGRRVALGVIGLIVCVQMGRVLAEPRGDFHLHWRFGARLVAGEFPYDEYGLDLPYLPFWAVAHAPLSFLPMHAAQILILPIFLLAAFGLYWVLRKISEANWPLEARPAFWTAILTTLLASRFWIRDILECGVNLALVALAWGAFWCWRNRREWLGGSLLGFAIALKLTPALFLAWFAWKRQWKITIATSLIAGGLFLTPRFFLSSEWFVGVHQVWWHHASRGLVAENPVHGVLGEESIQNVSLRPAIARFLLHLPPDHNARFDHPLAAQFLDLSPHTAGWAVRLITAALVFSVAWQFRAPVHLREDSSLAWEAAAVSVMILLLSPLTWGQHCVGVIPALYLLIRRGFHRKHFDRTTWTVLGGYSLFVLLLNRGLIGKQGTYLLDSYYITTWCLVGLLLLVLRSHRQEQSAARVPTVLPLCSPPAGLQKAA